MEIIQNYSWPGNIRELRNCIERMVVLCSDDMLDISNLPENVRMNASKDIQDNTLDLNQQEALLISKALEECKGNRTLAAQKLGISRRTLHRRLHEYNLI